MACSWRVWLAQWRVAVLLLMPLMLLPLALGSQEAQCGYIMVLVAVFWMTEVAPLAITGLLPAMLFPMFGIMSSKEACLLYMNDTNMMFLGGITLALAVEYSRLHERIALCTILKIGQSPARLMVGFMLTTMMLSMWISNTAATAMMIAIVDAVVLQLDKIPTSLEDPHKEGPEKRAQFDLPVVESRAALQEDFPGNASVNDLQLSDYPRLQENNNSSSNKKDKAKDSELEQFRTTILLSIAYASNLGGTGTVTGTNPNLVLTGFLSTTYGPSTGLNYASWMLFCVPNMLLGTLAVAGAMLMQSLSWRDVFSKLFHRNKNTCQTSKYYESGEVNGESGLPPPSPETKAKEREAQVRGQLLLQYNSLGSICFHEAAVASILGGLVVLWFTRSPRFMPGWGEFFDVGNTVMVSGSTPALLAVFLLFVIPAQPRDILKGKYNPTGGLLTWKIVRERFPWEVLLIMGGGFVLAKGASESGLSLFISDKLRVFAQLPSAAAVLLITVITASMTEVMSNTAVISILLPILKELAVVLQVNPLYLMLPATITSSFAFMLPVATPPNALVFAVTNIRSTDMMRIGFVLNVLCLLVMNFSINTYGSLMFDLHTFPAWANTTIVDGN